MELSNEFVVSVPPDEAWAVLTDLERIAPCLPGAQLQEIDGDDFLGVVKVKVGPITAQYKGKAHLVELDADARRAVLSASGRDTKGQGNASASITAQLSPQDGGGTHVSLVTDLTLTGKVAQFGRGVLADVSGALMDQFVQNLETSVLAGSATEGGDGAPIVDDGPTDEIPRPGADDSGAPSPPTLRVVEGPEVEPVDLLQAAGTPVLKRLLPLALVAAVVVALLLRRRCRR